MSNIDTPRLKHQRTKLMPIITEKLVTIEQYWRQARDALARNDDKKALDISERVRIECQNNGDKSGMENCYKFQGDVYFRFNDIRNALYSYQVQKNLNEETRNYQHKMLAYKQLGSCYKLIKKYHLALINYKKLLQLAWAENSTEWELRAYDYIGLAYYYLGELEKSKYYHQRMWEGICEDPDSTVRKLSLKALDAKRLRRNNTEERGKTVRISQSRDHFSHFLNVSDDDDTELPSPRTGSGHNDQKFLPFYKPIEVKSKIVKKNTIRQSLSNRIRPFMLLSHLSPIESPNNYFYVEQMNMIRVRDQPKN